MSGGPLGNSTASGLFAPGPGSGVHTGHRQVVSTAGDLAYKRKQDKIRRELDVHPNIKKVPKKSVNMHVVKMRAMKPFNQGLYFRHKLEFFGKFFLFSRRYFLPDHTLIYSQGSDQNQFRKIGPRYRSTQHKF